MKKVKHFSWILISIVFLSSCKSEDPAAVMEEFYNSLNGGDVERAIQLSTPSAVEQINLWKDLGAFETLGDTAKLQIMDVAKPEKAIEGDTATVNYKIGDFNSNIQLLFTDGEWKVFGSSELKQMRLIEKSASEFFIEYWGNMSAFVEKFNGSRMRLKGLLLAEIGVYYSPDYKAVPFDFESMTVVQPNKRFLNQGTLVQLTLCSNYLERTGMSSSIEELTTGPNLEPTIALRTFVNEEHRSRLSVPPVKTLEENNWGVKTDLTEINFQTSFDFEGIFVRSGYDDFFENCQIHITEICE